MDLSALIFVALAVAWAAYLIPKALRHHEDGASSRTVEGFSTRMRVLARRESADGRTARLVVEGERTTAKPEATPEVAEAEAPERRPVPVAVRRAAAARAAARRRRVVLVILLVGVVVAALASASVVPWVSMTAPGVLLAAWLVACRLMVKKERAALPVRRVVPAVPAVAEPVTVDDDPVTEEIRVHVAVRADVPVEQPVEQSVAEHAHEPDPEPVAEQQADGWEPRPGVLPTYVSKEPAARRSVRTIDLDSTGVWTSGPHAGDSALAREAEAERATRPEQAERKRRAAGD
ncbi:hypothetical protein ABFT23_07480 [Nocardioides sp. C4-1]|uniref:divisome protein SepX/GlpR n=1 Tax=Nocardioides sp. C4-1 TaxID=3151851 RepID=UPI003265E3C9